MFSDNLIKELIKKHERVKFKHSSNSGPEEQELGRPYSRTQPTSFYDGEKFVDERCCGADVKLKKKLDLERIMKETRPDDWDE